MITKLCPRCRRQFIPYEISHCMDCLPIIQAENDQRKAATMKKYNKKYDAQRKPEEVRFYQSAEWKSLRDFKMANCYGLCEECQKNGIVKPATQIHHIIPIQTAEGWQRRLEVDNVTCLCVECHNKAHNRFRRAK